MSVHGSKSSFDRVRRAIASSSVLIGATTASAVFLGLVPGMGLMPSIFTLGVGALGVGSTIFVARKNQPKEIGSQLTPLTAAIGTSKDLQLKVEELHGLARIYDQRDSPLFPAVNGVLANVLELFDRMSNRLDEQSARIAAVRYTDTLTKLNRALGRRYYLDIEAHPELWSNPDERMEAVEAALNATGEQILRNIRQLNSSKDLIYQLSIDSLMVVESEEANRRDLGLN